MFERVSTMARRNNTTQAQCDKGHEYAFAPEGTETVQRANTVMVVGVTCEDCGRVFPLLPTRAKDNAYYLPRHAKPGAEKVLPKEPTAPATVKVA
jgi:hypothetical protein